VRIQVDPGGLQSGGYDSISQTVGSGVGGMASGLSGAEGGAGDASLAAAISDLAGALTTTCQAAVLSLSSLGAAVAKAGEHYAANEAAIANAERAR
jgi:hypothetical protein